MHETIPKGIVGTFNFSKVRAGSSWFSDKVQKYLTARFDLGEQTGRKADPQQVSSDMQQARDEQNNRLFDREEWLTKSQVQGFFSCLTAARRRQKGTAEIELSPRDLLREDQEADRQLLMEEEVANELRPQHHCHTIASTCASAQGKTN